MSGKTTDQDYDRTLGDMRVSLVYHTPDPEKAAAIAARICYSPIGVAELTEQISDEQVRSVLKTILTSGHLSALEHASYTFAIDGVSRAMTHQLVRHRLASYNQQSQRYVSYSEEPNFIIPPSIASQGDAAVERFLASCRRSFGEYRGLVESGIQAEDARYLLPNATETKIVVTMNIRELLHFFELRCCRRAQWEIRGLADWMLELARPTAPAIFSAAGPSCLKGPCPEGKMSCGKPFPRVAPE